MHIIWWPISLKRVAGSPAPSRAITAAQSRRVWASLRDKGKDPLLAKEARSGAPGFVLGFEFVIDLWNIAPITTWPESIEELQAPLLGPQRPRYQKRPNANVVGWGWCPTPQPHPGRTQK